MLLKSDLNDANGRPIEQVMFTRMAIESAIPAVALAPTLSGDSYAWYRQSGDDPAVAETGTPHWVVTRIPAGFNLKHYLRKRIRPDGDAAEHMVYSDGLATVSVYVEKIAAGEETLSGLSSMGAVNAFGSVVNGHQVVVVGEVPAETVEMMARSIESRGSLRE
jgi:sigma-E factor negative regulatory protein RseB